MKKVQMALLAAAALMGGGTALAKNLHPSQVEYVVSKDDPNRLTDLTATEINQGFHCISNENLTCSYTDPDLPSARVRSGQWSY